jgi:K+-sensing histidine kinase KdpD
LHHVRHHLRRDNGYVFPARIVSAGEFISGDGEVVEGVASVDESAITLQENISFARSLGAQVISLCADSKRRIADTLIGFARRRGVTHVVFGQSARSRWDILINGSIINRFLDEVRDAAVQVVPLSEAENGHAEPATK